MWHHKRRPDETTLDVTPLVDVVFLIIIFFMLSTTFIVLPGIQIQLPEASSQKIKLEREEFVLTVDKEGRLYFDAETVSREEMEARLRRARTEVQDARIILKGDRDAGYGRVIDLLSLAKDCGLTRIAIVTEDKAEAAEKTEGGQ